MKIKLNSRKFKKTQIATAVLLASLTGVSMAIELEEIVVTATKRAQSVQDVPLAITALSGNFIKDSNLNDVKDLVAFTPGVSGNSQDSYIDAISVRGIRTQDFGIGGDSSSAFFKNDLYEGRNGSAVTSLYDVERVEVLRGPQGFLFGRSAIGGAFSVHTAKAEIGSNDAYVDLDIAERDHVVAEAALNIPINDQFAMRLAAYTSQEDGFVENFAGTSDDLIEHDKQAIRWSTTTELEKARIYTTLEYETREQSASVYRAITNNDTYEVLEAALGPLPLRGNEEDADSDLRLGDRDDADILTAGLRVDYDLGFATLTSNTGYKDHDYIYQEDYDGTPAVLNNFGLDQKGEYFQQELRLSSNDDNDGPFSWYTGVSYYKENIDATFTGIEGEDIICQYYGASYNSGMTFSGCADLYAYYGSSFASSPDGLLTEQGRILGEYSGWGAYVNLDYAVSETVNLSLGLRYSKDTKEFAHFVPTPSSELGPYFTYGFSTTGYIKDKNSWDDLTPRALVTWKPDDASMYFASFTQGFKSGGFGSFAAEDQNGESAIGNVDITPESGFVPSQFKEEFIDSYELGYKGSILDGAANASVTAFYYEYEDLQVVVNDGQGAATVGNAGIFESYGLEASLTASLSENYGLYLALGYLNSEGSDLQAVCGLDNVNGCEGSSLFWAPEYTAAFALTGDYPLRNGNVRARLEGSYESERGGGFEGFESTKIDSYAEFAFRLTYESNSNWRVGAYVENLTDEFSYDGQNNNGGLIPSHFIGPKRPRTVGVTFGYNWGT